MGLEYAPEGKPSCSRKKALTVLSALATVLFSVTARAQSSNSPVVVLGIEQRTEAVLDYWTDTRIRSAVPVPLLVVPDRAPKPIVIDKKARSSFPLHPKNIDQTNRGGVVIFARNATVADVNAPDAAPNGKLFFVNGGTNYVCSAAAIDTDLILTAAHCAYNRDNKAFSSDLMFALEFSPTSAGQRFAVSITCLHHSLLV